VTSHPLTPAFLVAGDPRLAPSDDLADAGALVAGCATSNDQVRRHRDHILGFLAAHPDALHRSCVSGHLTGSALVVEEGTGRLLVLFHRKLQRWLQPGGHADGDANLAAVALREATEETGIDTLMVDPVPIDLDVHRVEPPGEAAHDHLDIRFLVVAPRGAVPAGNHESEALRWVRIEQLDELGVDQGTIRMARAGLGRHPTRPLERP
jgi:8-oxo-dGTP pyrophosphatase MutT (NUDIX family)